MNTLKYYENYRIIFKRHAHLEGRLRFMEENTEQLLLELNTCRCEMDAIENSLRNYIPCTLPYRNYVMALEEREFLFYRCIKRMTMSETAEMMAVSRDTVYRIRRRIAQRNGTGYDFDDT